MEWKKYLQLKVSVTRNRERQSAESPMMGSLQLSLWSAFCEYSDETVPQTLQRAFIPKVFLLKRTLEV